MAINTWKIWQKLGIVKPKKVRIDVEEDVKAVLEFLKGVRADKKKITKLLNEYMLLRSEEKMLKKEKAAKKKLVENVKKQIEKYD